jgi:uncharacterized membrane protein HdeD (DUF308 family)
MPTSILLAKLIGPLMLTMAACMIGNPRGFRTVLQQISESPALVFLTGVLSLVAGLAIVQVRGLWMFDWPIVVVGWLAVLSGAIRIVLPEQAARFAVYVYRHDRMRLGWAAVLVIFGAVLTFKGYMS